MPSKTALSKHVFIVHHVPGRIRLRIPGARDDPRALAGIGVRLGELPGVTGVDVRHPSASMIVSYRPVAGFDSLDGFRRAAARRGLRIAVDTVLTEASYRRAPATDDLDGPSRLAREVDRCFGAANRAIKRRTGNLIDLDILVPLVAASAATINMRTNRSTPLWLTLLIFSFNALLSTPSRRTLADPTGRTR